jgi:Ca2+-transporting ATPase
MLWINLIIDTLGALALATEPPNRDLLKLKPYNRDERIINAVMWRNITGQAIYQMVVLLALLFFSKELLHIDYDDSMEFYEVNGQATLKCEKFTMIFNIFVMMQFFNEINCRKIGDREFNVLKNFFNNYLFQLVLTFTLTIQILMVEYGG